VAGVCSTLTAVSGVFDGLAPSPTASSGVVIVHSHFRFLSFRFRFRAPGVSRSLSAILRLISSKGPGVCPPSRVDSPVYAMVTSKGSSCFSFSGSVAENGESSAKRSICDLTYLFVVIVCVKGSLYSTFLLARFARRIDARLGVAGVGLVRGGRGEFRRML